MEIGSSVLVPSVQQLAKEQTAADSIPQRYIRPDLEPTHHHHHHLDAPDIPVVDFQRLLDPHSMHSELSVLDSASRNWGFSRFFSFIMLSPNVSSERNLRYEDSFLQLVNHGVSSTMIEKVKRECGEFFNLPDEEKKRYWQKEGDMEGFGQLFVVSEEQKLDWSDIFFMVTQPIHLRKPHLFRNLPLPLRETLDHYSSEMKTLAVTILDKMATALNIKEEEMEEYCKEMWQSMRINYYPPCPQPDKVVGLTPHSDGGALTILLQLNDVEGLEIMKDGNWVSGKPLPDAFIVNVGDILEMITNGEYKSIMHRATVNSDKERMSIATFHSPRYECEIGPAPSLVAHTKANPLYKTLTVQQFYKGFFSRELYAKSYLDTLKI